jgi:chitinase
VLGLEEVVNVRDANFKAHLVAQRSQLFKRWGIKGIDVDFNATCIIQS